MVLKRADNDAERCKEKSVRRIYLWQVLISVFILVIISCFLYIQYILNLTTIYPNIHIDGIEVGGLSCDEAILLLKENMDKAYLNDFLILSAPQKQYRLYFSDIGYIPDYEKAVELAYKTGRTGNVIDKLREIWNVRKSGLYITPTMCYNIEKTVTLLESIRKETYIDPQNAEIKINNGKIEIKPHTPGLLVDVDKSLKTIDNFLINREWNDVEIYIVEVLPDVTTQRVEYITYKLGEFETAFNPDNESRVHNIKTACNKINQKLLLPDEEFSMDRTLGERTEQNGYKRAKVIVNNELVDGLGGGICQVTSTAYNSVLLSGLEVLERRNHTLPSSYIEMGRDATISQGYIDFRFKNNSGYTVLIEAKTVGNKVIVTIWGREPKEKTTTRIRTKIIEVIEANGVEEIVDPSLKPGETVVIQEAKPGYKVEVYKDILDLSGNVIKTEKISVDTYQPQRKKVRVGAYNTNNDEILLSP